MKSNEIKFSESQIQEIRGMRENRIPVTEIAQKFNISVSGLLNKSRIIIPIAKIQNIDLKTSFVQQLGTIRFDTAGTSYKEMIWQGIRKPQEIFNQVSSVIHV